MTDEQTLDFVRRLLNSEFWKWIVERLEARERNVFKELTNPTTTADGRAMLNGRLIEIKDLENFPMTTLIQLEDQQKQTKQTENGIDDSQIRSFTAPNIVY